MDENGISDARRRLIAGHRPSAGWGYHETTSPAVEPTALAGLGLLSTDREIARSAGDWLATLQKPDGSLGVSTGLTGPGWPTPYGCLLWMALDGYSTERSAAINWLVATEGRRIPRDDRSPIGHDMQLVGWPWIAGTHSWIEPTCMALLVLGRNRMHGHPRVVEGLKVLRDRAIVTGGWNMGNPKVFDTPLRAFPAPTGLALLAMAQVGSTDEPTVAPAIAYLKTALPETLAPASLAWGLLGLRAWGAAPRQSGQWLSRAYDHTMRRPVGAMALALLILAAQGDSLESLGITPRESSNRDG